MTLRSITLYSNKGSKGRAIAVPAPRFRAFGIEPASGLAASRINRISQINQGELTWHSR